MDEDFTEPKKDLTMEFVNFGVMIHDLLDEGTPLKELHEYVDQIYKDHLQMLQTDLDSQND